MISWKWWKIETLLLQTLIAVVYSLLNSSKSDFPKKIHGHSFIVVLLKPDSRIGLYNHAAVDQILADITDFHSSILAEFLW